ncbi:tail protein X [Zooshikella marina]|uniref:tail protein X n=1 Tax=Zooshikella ganghwensis TaxID=202772 RepID=UPI001BAEDABD|nr:tail protein X [Zooshikella ganghwensis]MBU2709312.1 tail protein X [Zooshikella ganghwensis]
MQYRTKQNDSLDAICWHYYDKPREVGYYVLNVLAANPDLAELGPVLPAGLTIELPDLSSPVQTTQKLWD